MADYKITTPVLGFTGVSVGVNFTNGVAEIDSETQAPALAYFRAQGYGVEPLDEPETVADEPLAPVPVDPLTPVVDPNAPARSASKSDWVVYAVSKGMDENAADKATRDQLVELFLDKKGAAS